MSVEKEEEQSNKPSTEPKLAYLIHFPLFNIHPNGVGAQIVCSGCQSLIPFSGGTEEIQFKRGEGVQCPKCGRAYFFIACGRCASLGVIDDTKVKTLKEGDAVPCPTCQAPLVCLISPILRQAAVKTTMGDIFYILLPPSSKQLPADRAVVLRCSNCNSVIHKTRELSEAVHCTDCNVLNSLVACPNCWRAFLLDESKITRLKSNEILNCPICEALLIWPAIWVSISGRASSTSGPWSDDSRESDYLSRGQNRITNAKISDFQVYHRTTGSRILGAQFHLGVIRETKRRAFEISNSAQTPKAENKFSEPPIPEDILLDIQSLGFLNSLRSALDTLAQELGVFFSLNINETGIHFNAIKPKSKKQLGLKLPAVIEKCVEDFRDGDDYKYICKLRNCVQHRRIWLPQKEANFDIAPLFRTEESLTVQPESVSLLLPDDPDNLPGNQTYNDRKELGLTFSLLLENVKEFIFQVYDLAR